MSGNIGALGFAFMYVKLLKIGVSLFKIGIISLVFILKMKKKLKKMKKKNKERFS